MNDYAQRVCIHCLVGHCDLCVGRYSDRWCQCTCDWLIQLGGTMTELGPDTEQTGEDEFPPETDPAQIPPDEGDAGAGK